MRQPDIVVADVDVVVVGGGPAGSAVAGLLADWGHRVLVLTKATDPAHGAAESLPPSTRKLLDAIGVRDAVDRAGFLSNTGNTVWWGSGDGRVETFPSADAGYQVFRPRFDALLIERAERAQAQVVRDASVRWWRRHADGGALVAYECPGRGLATVTCRFVLDCSGRAGVIARQPFRRYQPGYRMQALLGVWSRDNWGLPGPSQTLVETYQDGWAWSIPVSAATRQIGVMVDVSTTPISRGPTIASTYRSELAKTAHLAALVAGATLQRAWACDASLYRSDSYAGDQFLLIGDAASTIDPLSSFGVKKALASAWVGAVVVHTCLAHAERRSAALGFFSDWERRVYVKHLRRSREHAREAYQRHPEAFWALRAETQIVDAADEADDDDILRTPGVQAAFERLKSRSSIDLRVAIQARIGQRAVIRGREIVLEEAVMLAGLPQGVRYLAGVDLLRLRDLAPRHSQVSDLFDAYCHAHAPVSLPGFLGGLSVLVAHGILTQR